MLEIPTNSREVTPDVFAERCPANYLLGKIGGKWNLLVLDFLGRGPCRNGRLLRAIEGISQKMLTQTLRDLEALRLVQRHDLQTVPPNVQYELSGLGHSLREKVCALDRWVEEHMFEMIEDNAAVPVKRL